MNHDSADTIDFDPRYLEGIRHFNKWDFFESHEAWEAMWLEASGPDRRFLQGLIQAAVALHHLNHGNVSGAKKLLAGAQKYLHSVSPRRMGLDIESFLGRMQVCFEKALAEDETRPRLAPSIVPSIRLEPNADERL